MFDLKLLSKLLRPSLKDLQRIPGFQAAKRICSTLAEFGTEGYPTDTKRRLMILNMIAYLIAITTLIYAIQHTFLDYEKYKPVIWINIALVGTSIAVPFSHRINDMVGGLIIVVTELLALVAFCYYLGRSAGVHLQLFIAAAAPFVVFGLKRLWLIIPIIIIAVGLHLYAWFQFSDDYARIHADPDVINSIYVQAAITTFALIAATVYYAFTLTEQAKAQVDSLLRNILPEDIVERLKLQPDATIADNFSEASILFADITGFVALARQLGAKKTVATLNEIVTAFDALSVKHGVEKIKTIGDAYMAAAGVPQTVPDHTARLARLALDMQAHLKDMRESTGLALNMRIGIASGPIMAGIIGKKKFSYDIWGDAVNLAARLEGLSEPGRILMCPSCRENLNDSFQFESKGLVQIKGVGEQEAWFLTAAK
ncbi:MAG: adenylate/guanylate cyclase domain-containing protein [Alphaproteobacteria bacterium]|nr:adenylate/guanylate cyclase domain-containing protein [Alphaproteobacteria bacterium]